MENITNIALTEIKEYALLAAKNVLSVDDVMLLTGLTKGYIYKLTCRKEIPYYKPNGKLIYFSRKEVEAWMMQNRVSTVVEAEQGAAKHIAGKGGRL